MTDQNRLPRGCQGGTDGVPRRFLPELVVDPVDGAPVHLLLVTEWTDTLGLHLAWPWLPGDVRTALRQAYQLEDRMGRSLPLLDSRVLPLAGRMNELTYFDTSGVTRPQVLSLRLRAQLAEPIAIRIG